MALWRRLAIGGAVTAALASIPLVAGADSGNRVFVAGAQASGVFVRYGIPGFTAVETFIDSGGPIAQSVLESTGTSASFSSFPYPGSNAMAGPGLIAFATGSAPPGYPLYADASHPTKPEQVVGDRKGPYSLWASAAEHETRSEARSIVGPGPDGPGLSSSRAASTVAQATDAVGAVTARSSTLAQGIAVGDLLVGSVRSSSETTYVPGDAAPTSKTDLVLEGGRAGPLSFSFGREGLRVSNQGLPLPADQGLGALNQALAPGGLAVRFDEGAPVPGGAMASVFEVVSTGEIPGAGQGTFLFRFGGATSWVALGESQPALDLPVDGVPPVGFTPPQVGGSASESSASPVATPAAPGASRFVPSSPAVLRPPPRSPTPLTMEDDVAASFPPVRAAVPARPALTYGEPLVSPRNFDAPALVAGMSLVGGFLVASVLVLWQVRRRLV